MPFERHAFISYAHIDNQPLPTEKDGWVTLFHEALQQLLAGRLGGNADIWRDHKLQGNDVFSDEIIQQLAKTAVFISVLTPRYLNSEWCAKEVGHFCTAAQETGGVVLDDNKCRVFKVLKLPIERQDALPPSPATTTSRSSWQSAPMTNAAGWRSPMTTSSISPKRSS
jgi:hypothetical protein